MIRILNGICSSVPQIGDQLVQVLVSGGSVSFSILTLLGIASALTLESRDSFLFGFRMVSSCLFTTRVRLPTLGLPCDKRLLVRACGAFNSLDVFLLAEETR